MWGTIESTSQDGWQALILAIAIICIPIMLLVKPYHLISKQKSSKQKGKQPKSMSDDLEGQFE